MEDEIEELTEEVSEILNTSGTYTRLDELFKLEEQFNDTEVWHEIETFIVIKLLQLKEHEKTS